jgi:hypothetical protein
MELVIALNSNKDYIDAFYLHLRAMVSANQKENILAIKKMFVIAAIFALFSTLAAAQDSSQTEPALSKEQINKLIKAFSRSAMMDGVILSFVLLNDKTVDALFQGDSRYAMRARANSATTFLIQGVPEKDITLDPQFEVEQNGKTFKGKAINMQNLEAGYVLKGARITGLFQLGEKIDVTQPFKIKGAQIASAEFKLSEDAIKLLTN